MNPKRIHYIRLYRRLGWSMAAIARYYGLGYGAVRKICNVRK
jgi:hypothetical protein